MLLCQHIIIRSMTSSPPYSDSPSTWKTNSPSLSPSWMGTPQYLSIVDDEGQLPQHWTRFLTGCSPWRQWCPTRSETSGLGGPKKSRLRGGGGVGLYPFVRGQHQVYRHDSPRFTTVDIELCTPTTTTDTSSTPARVDSTDEPFH